MTMARPMVFLHDNHTFYEYTTSSTLERFQCCTSYYILAIFLAIEAIEENYVGTLWLFWRVLRPLHISVLKPVNVKPQDDTSILFLSNEITGVELVYDLWCTIFVLVLTLTKCQCITTHCHGK